jgi:O-antigen ligase
MVPVLFTIVVVWIRHSGTGFSFETVEDVMKPFYRNKVDYALMLGVIIPFAWIFRDNWRGKYTGAIIVVLLIIAMYFAYTRAAYLGLLIGAAGLLCIRTKTLMYAMLISVAGLVFILVNLSKDNRYIDFAPDYNKTISHRDFDNLLEATYKLEDISSMERVYRWIAGFYMIDERPWLGFGPGSFYESYMPYTDKHFITYVSDNPERSGIHNYFLMTATDQGLPGLVIFLALLIFALLKAQWLYNRLDDGFPKKMLSACIVTLFFIIFILLLNDMIETDKVGSFFFFSLAMIVMLEERYLTKRSSVEAPQ